MNLQELKITIPAGGRLTQNSAGLRLRCLSADKAFLVRFQGGASATFEAGLSWTAVEPFKNFDLINPHNEDVAVKLIVSDGLFEDNRSVFSSNDPIPAHLSGQDGPLTAIAGGTFPVSETGRGTENEPGLLRYGAVTKSVAHTVASSSWSLPQNATEIISAAENVSGVIVRSLTAVSPRSDFFVNQMFIDDIRIQSFWGRHVYNFHVPFLLKAGQKLAYNSSGLNGATVTIHLTYDEVQAA